MMLRHSFGLTTEANAVEAAVGRALAEGPVRGTSSVRTAIPT